MKTYFVNYSMLGGGVLEIVANSAYEADSIAMDVSMEILMRTTDFGGGFSIDHIVVVGFCTVQYCILGNNERWGFVLCYGASGKTWYGTWYLL